MSSMYIRSQDREKLYRLGGNYACVEYGSATARVHGKGGELGIKAVTGLVGLIETLKDCGTCQEVQSVFDAICGYNACCIRCEFIDEKGADELMELVSMLAGQEMARCKNSCGKGTE